MHRYISPQGRLYDDFSNELHLAPIQEKYRTVYRNRERPENGSIYQYTRRDYYCVVVADYHVSRPVAVTFNDIAASGASLTSKDRILRFGSFFDSGSDPSKNDGKPCFPPSSYFAAEPPLKGKLSFKKGQHILGTEIILRKEYFTEVVQPIIGKGTCLQIFQKSCALQSLPPGWISLLQSLQARARENALNPLTLESLMLGCASLILEKNDNSNDSFSSILKDERKVHIGRNRVLNLSPHDMQSIEKARQILLENLSSPPTIIALGKMVFLNPQKLKAGFSHYYQMTIGEFASSMRMSLAADLLCNTDKSILEIAQACGYHYCSSFIKKFRQAYGCTPLQYRINFCQHCSLTRQWQ